jgi:CRISPR-associated protein Cmr1
MPGDKRKELTVKLKTLTPMWTGDVEGKCSEIEETGILGSIRWWYEVLNRGRGLHTCSPTDQNKCSLDNKEFIKSILAGKTEDQALRELSICLACQLFGCNGWSSKLRLIINDQNGKKLRGQVRIGCRNDRSQRGRRSRHRRVGGKIFTGDKPLILKFQPLKGITEKEWEILKFVLKLIANWGALGARTAQGNGVVEIVNSNSEDQGLEIHGLVPDGADLPRLSNFFFLKCRLEFKKEIKEIIAENGFWTGLSGGNQGFSKLWENHNFIPIAFHVRDAIRWMETDKNQRHFRFGKVDGKRKQLGSKVFVSHGYKINDKAVEVRIWGYPVAGSKNDFVSRLKTRVELELSKKLFAEESKYKVECGWDGPGWVDGTLQL